MTDVDRLLSEFIDAWNHGLRPSVAELLDQGEDPSDRSALADAVTAFLDVAPTPDYDESALRQLRAEPAVIASTETFAGGGASWIRLLPRWRKHAGLSIDELADQVLSAAGLASGDHAKAVGYLRSMEDGELDDTRISRRLAGLLARALNVDLSDLRRTGTPVSSNAAAMFRADDGADDLAVYRFMEVVSEGLTSPAPAGDWDEVDELFLGR